ncbi:hypothetical protein [Nocardioides sp.]|uniref:hypothetical protein n=1 Tax=Nocardioides sp. TaxID=35761 RepID=UPI00356A04B9
MNIVPVGGRWIIDTPSDTADTDGGQRLEVTTPSAKTLRVPVIKSRAVITLTEPGVWSAQAPGSDSPIEVLADDAEDIADDTPDTSGDDDPVEFDEVEFDESPDSISTTPSSTTTPDEENYS